VPCRTNTLGRIWYNFYRIGLGAQQTCLAAEQRSRSDPRFKYYHGSSALTASEHVPLLKIQGTSRDQNMDPSKIRAKTNNMSSSKPRDPKKHVATRGSNKGTQWPALSETEGRGMFRSRSWFQDAPRLSPAPGMSGEIGAPVTAFWGASSRGLASRTRTSSSVPGR
jgi:hypothetical protein